MLTQANSLQEMGWFS